MFSDNMNHEVDSLAVITNKKIIATLPSEMVESLAQRALKSCIVYVVVVGDINDSAHFNTAGITLIKKDVEFIIIKDIIGEVELKYHKGPFRQKYKKYIINDKISLKSMDFETLKQFVKDIDQKFVKCRNGVNEWYRSNWHMYQINEMTFYS